MLAPFTYILWFLFLTHLLFVSSPEPKAAQSDVLVCQWSDVILFIEVYISKVNLPILKFHVKHNQVGERLHKVFGLIGLELWLPWQHIAPIDL